MIFLKIIEAFLGRQWGGFSFLRHFVISLICLRSITSSNITTYGQQIQSDFMRLKMKMRIIPPRAA